MNNDNPSNLIPPAVAALATVVNAAQETVPVSAEPAPAPTPAQNLAPVQVAPAQVAPVSAAPAQNLAPVSAATSAVIAASAPVIAAQAAQKPAQNPAAPTPVSAAPAGQNPAPTAQNLTPTPTPASAPTPAAPKKPLPSISQTPNQETIKNAINNSLTKYPLEISNEKGQKYKMIISSDFSKLDPVFPQTATDLFKTKIFNIQKAINHAVSCINMKPKLYMKVTVQEANQSGGSGGSTSIVGVGGNKKMRQTKKMKKRKH